MKSYQLCGTEIRWRTEQKSVGVTRMNGPRGWCSENWNWEMFIIGKISFNSSQFSYVFKFTANYPISSNVLLSVYWVC